MLSFGRIKREYVVWLRGCNQTVYAPAVDFPSIMEGLRNEFTECNVDEILRAYPLALFVFFFSSLDSISVSDVIAGDIVLSSDKIYGFGVSGCEFEKGVEERADEVGCEWLSLGTFGDWFGVVESVLKACVKRKANWGYDLAEDLREFVGCLDRWGAKYEVFLPSSAFPLKVVVRLPWGRYVLFVAPRMNSYVDLGSQIEVFAGNKRRLFFVVGEEVWGGYSRVGDFIADYLKDVEGVSGSEEVLRLMRRVWLRNSGVKVFNATPTSLLEAFSAVGLARLSSQELEILLNALAEILKGKKAIELWNRKYDVQIVPWRYLPKDFWEDFGRWRRVSCGECAGLRGVCGDGWECRVFEGACFCRVGDFMIYVCGG